VVVVDESFRARLEPSMYNGPRDLIKKEKTFKATATITKIDGSTIIIVHDVTSV